MTFGQFLALKRMEKRISVRKFATLIHISPSFLCDLESEHRAFPANSRKFPNLLDEIISALALNDEDSELIRNLAKESMLIGNRVPSEISDYLKKVPEAQQALRIASEKGVCKEDWENFVKLLESKK